SRETARTLQVSERYFPSRLGRIPSVAGSKSGAWRFTTSITACANPTCVFPMTLMGKSQGKARTGESFSGMGGGAHHPGFVLLVQRVDALADAHQDRLHATLIRRETAQHAIAQ